MQLGVVPAWVVAMMAPMLCATTRWGFSACPSSTSSDLSCCPCSSTSYDELGLAAVWPGKESRGEDHATGLEVNENRKVTASAQQIVDKYWPTRRAQRGP